MSFDAAPVTRRRMRLAHDADAEFCVCSSRCESIGVACMLDEVDVTPAQSLRLVYAALFAGLPLLRCERA